MPDQLETIVQRMIDAGEPEENIAAVIQQSKQQNKPPMTAAEHVKNVASGVIPGAIDAVMAIPEMFIGLSSDLIGMVQGLPPAYTNSVLKALGDLPSSIKNASVAEREKMIGGIVGNIVAGGAMGAGAKPTARVVGPAIENAATRPSMRWAGAAAMTHGLMHGNPIETAGGVGAMAAPEAIGSVGRAITRFGGGETLPAKTLRTKAMELNSMLDLDEANAAGKTAQGAETAASRAERAAAANKKAAERNQKIELTGRLGYEADKAKEQQNVLKLSKIEAQKKGLQPTKTTVTESTTATSPEGEQLRSSQSFGKDKSGITPAQQKLLDTIEANKASIRNNPNRGIPQAPIAATVTAPPSEPTLSKPLKIGRTPDPQVPAKPVRLTSLKPDQMTPQQWQEARRMFGHEKLAAMTGLSPEEVLKRAPGPSRLPLEAESEMMDMGGPTNP